MIHHLPPLTNEATKVKVVVVEFSGEVLRLLRVLRVLRALEVVGFCEVLG